MDLFICIIMALLLDSLTAMPGVEHRPSKVTSTNTISTSERNSEGASSSDLTTSDTYGFAYYPQYYATNMNNPTMATNGFGQNNYMGNGLKSSSNSNTPTPGNGNNAVNGGGGGGGYGGAGPFNGVSTPSAGIQFIATPIYSARLNIVPYEIMPIRVRSNPKYDNGQSNKMNGQGSFDRRANGAFDKNSMIIGNGGGTGHANSNGAGYNGGGYNGSNDNSNGNGSGQNHANGNGNSGGLGSLFYNDLYHQSGRRYTIY